MDKVRISQSGNGLPLSIVPKFVGQIYIDELSGTNYRGYGLSSGQWHLIIDSGNVISNTLSTDKSYTGIIENGTIGESVVFGDILYLKFSDGKWWKAKADSYLTTPGTRMSLGTYIADATGLLLIQGTFRDDSMTLTGNRVWLSAATAGVKTTTQPSSAGNQIQLLGIAKTATTMFFKPSYDVGEI